MFRSAHKEKMQDWEFLAAVHGANIKGEGKSKKEKQKNDPNVRKITGDGKYKNCVLGEPETYSHFSIEERREMTKQMMKKMGFGNKQQVSLKL